MSEVNDESRVDKLLDELTERAKELECLYRVEELLNDPDAQLEEVLTGVADALPPGLQFPESSCAKIVYKSQEYRSKGFVETPWLLSAEITLNDEKVGAVKVYYTEEMPQYDEGPFLKEEVKLIKTVAFRVGHFAVHQSFRRAYRDWLGAKKELSERTSREWRVVLNLVRKTDQGLYARIGRRMLNHLYWSENKHVQPLLERFNRERRGEDAASSVETNQPRQKLPLDDTFYLSGEIFEVAATCLSDQEILNRIQRWIQEDRSSFLVKVLASHQSSLSEIGAALRRFRTLASEGIELSLPTLNGLRVSLVRRFLTEQLEFINIAKKFVEVGDFYHLLERTIFPVNSHGKLGGKGAGLFLAMQILRRADSSGRGSFIKTPRTWYIASDGILDFLQYNNLEELGEQKYKEIDQIRQEYSHVIQVFKNSHFSPELIKGLSMALDDFGEVPLIVRSSSLLEDRLHTAFSGKYKSLFLANQGTKQERLEALTDAVAEVYASTLGPDPIEYRAERGLLDFNEEMGILIQEVVGSKVGRYFLPSFAGVAFSNNEFRWSPRIKRDDGLIRVVPGLGTRAVDRVSDDYAILVAPSQPGLRVNSSVEETLRYAPRKVDVINLETNSFETVELRELLREYGPEYPRATQVVSVHRDGVVRVPLGFGTDWVNDELVVTFEGLLSRTTFVKDLEWILKTLQEKLGTPVDIEFAHDGKDFYLLQCRPQSDSGGAEAAPIPKDVPEDRILFSATRYVSNGRVPDVTHVVYVDPTRYNELRERWELQAVGRAIGRLNKLLPKRQFILIGPGRWGSRGDIKLGVAVTYSDINNASMLIEVARKKGNYVPELSFGTHFFQDLVEASIRYLPLYPDDPGIHFNERFMLAADNVLPRILPEYASLADTIRVIDVPESKQGMVLRVLMNAELEEALAFFTRPSTGSGTSTPQREVLTHDRSDYWRWRQRMAEQIAAELDADRFGVVALYVFGSTKNATAGPGSDIDLLVHFRGSHEEREGLKNWLEGWSLALGEMNYLRTGYRTRGLLDVHIVTDEDIAKRRSFAVKIGAVTDAARKLPLKH